jgi:hypothetical protein
LPALGPNVFFPYGLAIGVCVAIVNLHIISITIGRAVGQGKTGPVIAGFIIRILLYGGAFVMAVKTSGLTGLGVATGFLLPRVTLYIRYGLLPVIRRKLGKEPPPVYVTDSRSNMLVKDPSFIRYSGGKVYMTHRHYRKVKKHINE